MKHLAAFLLLELAGKTPNDKSIKSLLDTVGIETDDARLKQLIKELDGKSTDEVFYCLKMIFFLIDFKRFNKPHYKKIFDLSKKIS